MEADFGGGTTGTFDEPLHNLYHVKHCPKYKYYEEF